KFNDTEICIGSSKYQDREHLQKLRVQYAGTHIFYRNKNQILSVAIAPEKEPLGESVEKIWLSQNLFLSAALIRASLVNYIYSLGRKLLGYEPIQFISNLDKDNFLNQVLPEGSQTVPWLSIKPLYTAAVRTVNFDYQPLSLGLVLDVKTTRWINLPCNKLLEKGVSITGLYVSQLVPSNDYRMTPRLRLLGRVQAVKGEELTLTDSRLSITTINASQVFLEPRIEAFNRCLEHLFGEDVYLIKQQLDAQLAIFRSGPSRLEKLISVIQYLAKQTLELVPGTTFTFEPFLTEANPKTFPKVCTAPSTTYVFDSTGEKTDIWNDRGLNKYGPYTTPTFTPSKPRVCVICQKHRKGRVEQFLYKFKNGVTVPNLKHQPFDKGAIRKYHLEGFTYEFFLADDSTSVAYDRAIRQALRYQHQHGFKWDLALVQIEEIFHQLYGDSNPYLTTKAAFLVEQIPVQEFEIETIDVSNYSLCYVLNNIGLAIYAKLGGIPWLIKANPTIAHELVFGLGSAYINEGRLGDRERVVGITTVFSGDGNYRLANLSQAVPFTEYAESLLQSLQDTISKIKRTLNWQAGEHIRLIFHSFKPLRDAEAEAVKKLMEEMGDYNVDYAFIHLIDDHPYILFNELEAGIWDRENHSYKGVYAPRRGEFFRLSQSEVLLTLKGAKELKRPQDGIPQPILLRLHKSSTFQDTTYLTRQVFTFACHSWQSFFPSPIPVTIVYSKLIARMLGQLGTVSSWNPNVMLGRIGETRWFL
ncbi:Piwi domain-containing protein, partial [Nostoc sp. NIES-2111]